MLVLVLVHAAEGGRRGLSMLGLAAAPPWAARQWGGARGCSFGTHARAAATDTPPNVTAATRCRRRQLLQRNQRRRRHPRDSGGDH